jgi:hypothetical protein
MAKQKIPKMLYCKRTYFYISLEINSTLTIFMCQDFFRFDVSILGNY